MKIELFFGVILCGLFSMLTVGRLIDKFKKIDNEIELPASITVKEYMMIFLCGAAAYQGICISTIVLLYLGMYLSFMAYTDFHTKKVYSMFSYLIFVAGAVCLFMTTDSAIENIYTMLAFAVLVLLGFFIKAYAFGDVEIYIALYPYYAMYFFDMPEDVLSLMLWFAVTLFITVIACAVTWLVSRIKGSNAGPDGFSKGRKAMAPIIAFAHVMLLCMNHFG